MCLYVCVTVRGFRSLQPGYEKEEIYNKKKSIYTDKRDAPVYMRPHY